MGIPAEEIFKLMQKGGYKPNQKVTPEELQEVLRKFSTAAVPQKTTLDELLGEVEDVHLVFIRDSVQNIEYVTIAYGGKVFMTLDDEGKLSREYVLDNIDDLFKTLVESGLPNKQPLQTKARGKGGGSPSGKKKKDQTRGKPQIFYDPHLINYFNENAHLIVHDACSSESEARTRIREAQDLERILPGEFLHRAAHNGIEVHAQKCAAFIAAHGPQIRQRRVIYLSGILNDEAVQRSISDFLDQMVYKDSKESRILSEFATRADNARLVYNWFSNPAHRLQKYAPHDVVTGLREFLLMGHKKDPELATRIGDETLEWIAVSIAGEYVRTNEFMQKDVVPYFKKVAEGVGIEHTRWLTGDEVFEGMLNCARKVVDTETLFTLKQYQFCMRGLWALGLLVTDKKESGNQRKLRSSLVTYVDPMSHLVKRFKIYDPLLKKAFAEGLGKAEYSSVSEMRNQRDYSALAVLLYRHIHPAPPLSPKDTVFLSLNERDVRVLNPPYTSGGDHLSKILKMYVGINKDFFNQRLKKSNG